MESRALRGTIATIEVWAIARRKGMIGMAVKLRNEAVAQLDFEWPGATLTDDENGVTIVLGDIRRSFKWDVLSAATGG